MDSAEAGYLRSRPSGPPMLVGQGAAPLTRGSAQVPVGPTAIQKGEAVPAAAVAVGGAGSV